MPYRMKKDGKEWCVYNSDTGDKKGCSATRAKAVAHMRALYAAESGAKMGNKEIADGVADELWMQSIHEYETESGDQIPLEELDTKEYDGEIYESMPFYTFATSFEEYEQQQEARRKQQDVENLISMFPVLANNVMSSYEIDPAQKVSAVENLSNELVNRLKEADGDDDEYEIKAISKREDVSEADKKRAVSEYGNVTYADPKNKKYPIDTEAHIRAAWNYINKPKNAAKYSSSEVASIKRRIISAWKSKIDKAGPPSASEKGLKSVFSKIKDLLSNIDVEDGIPPAEDTGMMVWKEGDNWMWFARYSNNFRDNDNPPEIISSMSHRRFVERVEKGLAPLPELWLWHVKEWKIGRANWVGYDEPGSSVIAMASGHFYPWAAPVAEWLSKQDDFAVSHGMPPETIVYEDGDVIIEHETREISPLPGWSAANKITGFVSFKSFSKEESEMAIPKDQKQKLVEAMGLDEKVIASIETANAAVAKEASDSGLESKEGDNVAPPANAEVATETPQAGTPPTPPTTDVKPPEGEEEEETTPDTKEVGLTVKEIAEAITAVLQPYAEKIELLEKSVADLSEKLTKVDTLEQKAAQAIAFTSPVASLVSMITNRAVGSPSTQVKEGDPIADSKPKETAAAVERTGIPFIDEMLAPSGK